MIRINLLPWREARRKAQRQHLGVLGGMVAVLGLLIVGAVHLTIAGYIAVQSDRNEFLKRENVRLDKEIEEIKKLKTEIAALLARKQIIERLQADRAQAVYMLQELVQQVPDGVYLKAIKQTGLKINMTGYAQSNARVSTLMRNFAASPYLENPDLVEIKAVLLSNKRVSEFIMNVSLKQIQSEAAGKSGKAAPKAAPAKG
ncbi:MAG: PilN domain-containing protein [Betaproteobacteria bacterium]|nr:MAG: PilN domain-containing protein [Betaproteobacteria bacterium]TMH78580.1 MAG: PilN domain-containing protein [Betaproteobacteria bacterium]